MGPLQPMTEEEAHTLLLMLSVGPGTLSAAVSKLLTDPAQRERFKALLHRSNVHRQDVNIVWKKELAIALSGASQVQPTSMAYAYYDAIRRTLGKA